MRKKTEMVRKNIYLTQKQIKTLEIDASMNGIVFSEMLRRILDKYIDGFMELPGNGDRWIRYLQQ